MPKPTVCLGCGETTTNGSRCPRCAGGTRSVPKSKAYRDPDYVRARARLLAHHRATFGPRCPRCLRDEDGTVARRLTANHVTTLSAPGADILGPLEVLCTSCNSKQLHVDRPDVARRGQRAAGRPRVGVASRSTGPR